MLHPRLMTFIPRGGSRDVGVVKMMNRFNVAASAVPLFSIGGGTVVIPIRQLSQQKQQLKTWLLPSRSRMITCEPSQRPSLSLTQLSSSLIRRFFASTTGAATPSDRLGRRPVAIFLNCSRLDYDRKLNFDKLAELTEFYRNDVDYVTDIQQIVELVREKDAEIVITKEMQVPTEAVQNFPPSVRLLCEAGTGYNNIPLQACRDMGIVVCNIPTYSTDAVAHTAITYIMNFSLSMLQQQRMLHEKDRSNFTGPFTLPLTELGGKTLGLVGGSGLIGSKVADIGLALGMDIIISSRRGTLPPSHRLADNPRVRVTADVNDLLRSSDYVSLHTPLNDETRGTFGREQISQMKPTAFLINTSRGKVCIEEELIDCMRDKLIAGAGLDVTATEPPSMDSGLWDLPNVWLSPHIGWRRLETRQRLVDMTCDNVRAYINATSSNEYINVVS